ncbi:MAG TPA: ABC transporter permease [Terriglobia bacterium]|nr:ABC transporter permease [Terriglobia bacterium]
MFWKLIREPLRRPRTRRRALGAVAAIALGTAVAAAMLSVLLDVGDRVGNELRSLGANIVVTPAGDSLPVEIGGRDFRPVSEGTYIAESSLPRLKKIFWGNNITAFSPSLPVLVRAQLGDAAATVTLTGVWFDRPVAVEKGVEFRTGVRALNPAWTIRGGWPPDDGAAVEPGGMRAVVGRSLAEKLGAQPGDSIRLAPVAPPTSAAAAPLLVRVEGILSAGGAEDDQILAPLDAVQAWLGLEDQVRTLRVSALIKPEDDLSRKGPDRMTPAEYDRWYCSPYLSSILHQIGEALPGTSSKAVRQVAETQGNVLGKLTFLMGLLALAALLAAGLSISSLASLTVLERREEIGLMKALGGGSGVVAGFLLTEAALEGLCGGMLGFAAGHLLAGWLGQAVFGTEVAIHWLLLPVILLVAAAVSMAGAYPAVLRAVREDPARVLRSV